MLTRLVALNPMSSLQQTKATPGLESGYLQAVSDMSASHCTNSHSTTCHCRRFFITI